MRPLAAPTWNLKESTALPPLSPLLEKNLGVTVQVLLIVASVDWSISIDSIDEGRIVDGSLVISRHTISRLSTLNADVF